ncbi:probable E3 ubiquitin-protein ligase MARCHF10 isoform X4 [Lepidochelys kempii]|uniref:probable E3 ubiquitin-protein ligase MARCHF10 isoform X4 n=1 Tax=Lepidochelys kempii TaxID=8472 RepID=UPI003C6FB883
MQSSSAEVTMMESQNRKRAPAWTEWEVQDLIAVRGEESVLSELHSSFRNAKTSQGMKDRGHNRDPKQCRVKLKELRQAYQKTREANGRSRSEPQTCRFYDELPPILGGSATTTPAVLFDSFNGDGGNTEAGFGDEEDDDEVVDSSQQASGETGFPDSQELFLTLDLEPVLPEPTQGCLLDPAGGEGTSDLGVTNETTLTNKKRSQERRNLIHSSKLNLDRKDLAKDSKTGSILPQAQQSPTLSCASILQGAHGSFVSNESHGPSLIPTKMAPLRFRDENFYSMRCLNMEDSYEENDTKEDILEKEFLSFNLNHSPTPLGQISKFSGTSLAQDEQCNSEEAGYDRSISSRRVESSHGPLRQHNVMDTAVEQSSLRRRNSSDYGKSYTPDGNSSEGADCNKNENETPLFSSRSSRAESRPGSAPIAETLNNISSIDRPSVNIYNRELQACESNQRHYTDLLTSARSTVHRRLLYSAYNAPRSLIQSAPRAEVSTDLSLTPVSSQVLDLDGSSRFNVRRPLSPIRSRDSFSAAESYESSSPIVSTPEDNSLLDDSIDNGLKSASPNAALHDEENLLNSHSSFLSIDSSNPSLFQTDFTAHLHMAGTLHDQLPLALLAVSDLQNQSSAMSSMTACDTTSAKETNKHADPEKLKKLQESLLAEDSEEEGDQCRICQIAGGSLTNPLVEPCGCVGTLQFVHQECLKTWLKAKIKSGAELGAVKTCELCKQSLIADLDDFDVNDYYRNHQQSQAQSELMNSGLYLVLLLHLYEQRFAELMRLNYNQASRDRLSRQPRAEENENSESGNNG